MRPKSYYTIEEGLRNRTVVNRTTLSSKNRLANFPRELTFHVFQSMVSIYLVKNKKSFFLESSLEENAATSEM